MVETGYKLENIVIEQKSGTPRIERENKYQVSLYSEAGRWRMCRADYVELNIECPSSCKW
ncbi:MAG: hypothetical protein AABX04_02120 [Nanoarchaeota archaeon]